MTKSICRGPIKAGIPPGPQNNNFGSSAHLTHTEFIHLLKKILRPALPLLYLLLLCLWGCTDHTPDYLKEVDAAIAIAREAQGLAVAHADSLADIAEKVSEPEARLRLELDAASAYQSIDLEKALAHTRLAMTIARDSMCAPESYVLTRIRLASIFTSQGTMLKEAADIFDKLDSSSMPDSLKLSYFILGVQINRALSDRSFDTYLRKRYLDITSQLRDSVLALDSTSTIIAVNKLIDSGRIEHARQLMLASAPTGPPTERANAPYYHYMAEIYRLLAIPDSQEVYLAKASVADLANGVREYVALPQLAQMIADKDLKRAHTYIHQSADDAAASHSARRQLELSASMGAIDAAYTSYQEGRTANAIVGSIIIAVIASIIAVALILLRRKNQALQESHELIRRAKEEVESANTSLAALNAALAEESRVKERYITSFMELCLSYLQKMERFRAELGKIAARADWPTLSNAINSSRYVNREIAEFYANFDQAFLTLYPNFIHTLNSLLIHSERYPEGGTFSTELRIYALIWLGIEASGDIAKFLRCSESTVYNYRTKMRNRAIDRDTFEERFASIARSPRGS